MRESQSDSWICLVALVVFSYYFFLVGGKVVYVWSATNPGTGWEPVLEYSTIVFIGPLIFFLFFGLILFKKELKTVTLWSVLFSLLLLLKIAKHKLRLHFK